MNYLSAREVRQLVTKAFVIEAITNKPGCTTRYVDLPGKPLQDFIMAGINSAEVFEDFVNVRRSKSQAEIYSHNLAALQVSNRHKPAKYINFGLLEIMFPTVAARLETNHPEEVIDKVVELTKETANHDVKSLLSTRQLAWSTSQTAHKVGFEPDKFKNAESVWQFYMMLYDDFPPISSNYQWAKQYKLGLPILRCFFESYMKGGEVLKSSEDVFNEQRKLNPEVAVGIIADMCAAAIFLWLSFNDGPVEG